LCAKRVIRLTKEDVTIVEFNAVIQAEQVSLLNKVQGTSLNKIRIAQEYPDVFPEDLPGMPLDHNIEFIIELLPGIPPISKRPYRMCHTRFLRPKPDAHRMYAQDQVVIHTVRM
jgi:hypothetical protein